MLLEILARLLRKPQSLFIEDEWIRDKKCRVWPAFERRNGTLEVLRLQYVVVMEDDEELFARLAEEIAPLPVLTAIVRLPVEGYARVTQIFDKSTDGVGDRRIRCVVADHYPEVGQRLT